MNANEEYKEHLLERRSHRSDFSWALRELKKGNNIKRKEWKKRYLCLNKGEFHEVLMSDDTYILLDRIPSEYLLAEDWVLERFVQCTELT